MPSIGTGVREIRLRDDNGIYRVIYLAKFAEAVFVIHCFEKKTQKTRQADIVVATARYNQLIRERKT